MRISLVIMAAGLGSRFGGGIKQLEPVGANGELIIDYSVHDAIKAGFNKIIFIIRKDIEKDFRDRIGNRIEKICAVCGVDICYAFQNINNIPSGFEVPAGRTKPWGTGHAVLAAKEIIKEPFAVINADDYYGKECFTKLYSYLKNYNKDKPYELCMAGFRLKNTLSDNGGVTRGICSTDKDGYLIDVLETHNIIKTASGRAICEGREIPADSLISMNMWGLTPEFTELLETGFTEFLENLNEDEIKSEFLLPVFINQLLGQKKVRVKVLDTPDKWVGVTYKEDKASVTEYFRTLLKDKKYCENLYDDIKD